MKLVLEAINKSIIKKYHCSTIWGYIVSIEGFSLDGAKNFSISELIELIDLIKKYNLKVIVNIARLFHEDELILLDQTIKDLPVEKIDYFMYSDFGVYQILENLGLKNKTLLYSLTYLTNVHDVKLYQELNGSVIISNQITSDELIKIANNAYENKFIMGFGKATIFYSRRPLLSNYFKYRGLKKDPTLTSYTLKEEYRDHKYHIIQNSHDTRILDYANYYLLNELKEIKNTSGIIISGSLLKTKQYEEVIKNYLAFISEKIDEQEVLTNFKNLEIDAYKGAYANKLTLLKDGASDE